MATDFEHSPLGHFTREVLTGNVRSVSWAHLRILFPAADPQETWRLLDEWAKAHRIIWSHRLARSGKGPQRFVDLERIPPT